MNCQVNRPAEQCFFQLFREQTFAAKLGQRAILNPISAGTHRDQFRRYAACRKSVAHEIRLRESKAGTAGSKFERELCGTVQFTLVRGPY